MAPRRAMAPRHRVDADANFVLVNYDLGSSSLGQPAPPLAHCPLPAYTTRPFFFALSNNPSAGATSLDARRKLASEPLLTQALALTSGNPPRASFPKGLLIFCVAIPSNEAASCLGNF